MGGAAGVIPGQVRLLAQVGAQIEQFHPLVLRPFDQLPVAAPDRRRRGATLIAVVRVVPEEGAFRQIASFENGQQTCAIQRLLGLRWRARRLQQGGEEVRTAHRRAGHAARWHHTGPANQQRLADAALIHPALAAAQGKIRGGPAFAGG